MSSRRYIRCKALLITTVGMGALAVAAVAAYGSIPGSDGSFHACVDGTTGALRVIDPDADQKCIGDEQAVSWSASGQPGAQGPVGPVGTLGLRSALRGPAGPKGAKGDPGPAASRAAPAGPAGEPRAAEGVGSKRVARPRARGRRAPAGPAHHRARSPGAKGD